MYRLICATTRLYLHKASFVTSDDMIGEELFALCEDGARVFDTIEDAEFYNQKHSLDMIVVEVDCK